MGQPTLTPEERFAALSAAFLGNPLVTFPTIGKRFGASALKVHGKIFAMLDSQQRLVVKLPRARVQDLIARGKGAPYDPRHDSRIMKEWVVITTLAAEDWHAYAQEALDFVAQR